MFELSRKPTGKLLLEAQSFLAKENGNLVNFNLKTLPPGVRRMVERSRKLEFHKAETFISKGSKPRRFVQR